MKKETKHTYNIPLSDGLIQEIYSELGSWDDDYMEYNGLSWRQQEIEIVGITNQNKDFTIKITGKTSYNFDDNIEFDNLMEVLINQVIGKNITLQKFKSLLDEAYQKYSPENAKVRAGYSHTIKVELQVEK